MRSDTLSSKLIAFFCRRNVCKNMLKAEKFVKSIFLCSRKLNVLKSLNVEKSFL